MPYYVVSFHLTCMTVSCNLTTFTPNTILFPHFNTCLHAWCDHTSNWRQCKLFFPFAGLVWMCKQAKDNQSSGFRDLTCWLVDVRRLSLSFCQLFLHLQMAGMMEGHKTWLVCSKTWTEGGHKKNLSPSCRVCIFGWWRLCDSLHHNTSKSLIPLNPDVSTLRNQQPKIIKGHIKGFSNGNFAIVNRYLGILTDFLFTNKLLKGYIY